jgi:ACS family hexuronate transporter-like MFS transporter
MAEEKKDHAKRLRYALIALVFVGTALNYVDRQVLALLKPTLEAEFDWSDQEFAHLGSAFQLTAAASVLFVGWLVDRFGVRAAYGGAVAIWRLAGIAHAFAATVGQFLAARIVLAAAESINTPAAVKAACLSGAWHRCLHPVRLSAYERVRHVRPICLAKAGARQALNRLSPERGHVR